MKFEVIDAKPHHVGQILRRMRAEETEAISQIGIAVHREMRHVLGASSFARAWMIDGRLAAIGGVTGMLASSEGHLWLVLSREALRHPVAMLKEAKRQFSLAIETRRAVTTTVAVGDTAGLRFAGHFGFVHKGIQGRPGFIEMDLGASSRRPVRRSADTQPFIVYALPRSRTAWLSAFLSYGGWSCFHEHASRLSSAAEIASFFSRPRTGSVETAAAPAWRLIRHFAPQIKVVVVRRSIDDVVDSLIGATHDFTYDVEQLRRTMAYGDRMLDQISALPGTLTVDWDNLVDEATCSRIFTHCLPFEFDRDWWAEMRDRNIQIDIDAMLRDAAARRPEIDLMKRSCWSELRRLRRDGSIGGRAHG